MATSQDIAQVTLGFDPVTATAFNDRADGGTAFRGVGVTEKQPRRSKVAESLAFGTLDFLGFTPPPSLAKSRVANQMGLVRVSKTDTIGCGFLNVSVSFIRSTCISCIFSVSYTGDKLVFARQRKFIVCGLPAASKCIVKWQWISWCSETDFRSDCRIALQP